MQPCVLSLIDHAHPAPTEFLDNAVMRDGLINHYIGVSFLAASSYGRGAGQSNENGSRTNRVENTIGILSGARTHTAIQDKKDHERMSATRRAPG
jgi:hypothetical protein